MSLTRRAVLAGALAAVGGVAGCSSRPQQAVDPALSSYASAAEEVGGAFSWDRAAGAVLQVVLPDHPASRLLVDSLQEFTALTGVEVRSRVLPDDRYFDDVTRALVAGGTDVDVFLTGPSTVWQYAPPGWMEDLGPWLTNPSATSDDYDVDDVLPGMRSTVRWDLVSGRPVGFGGQWAMPLCWEPVGLAYRADVFAELGLQVPRTLAELEDVAAACTRYMAARVEGGYGLALRGVPSWTTVDGAFISQFLREGGRDFDTSGGQLVPVVHSAESVAFHTRWTRMVRDAGPPRWTAQTSQGNASHLRNGLAAMSYDVPGGVLPSAAAAGPDATVAWSPGPAGPGGPGGDLTSNLWVWSVAVSSRSRQKLAAWLFVQWATGADHARAAALAGCVEPVRLSAAVAATQAAPVGVPGYRAGVDAVRPASRVAYTPQPYFFDAATAWVDALHEMHNGRDPESALVDLSDTFLRRG